MISEGVENNIPKVESGCLSIQRQAFLSYISIDAGLILLLIKLSGMLLDVRVVNSCTQVTYMRLIGWIMRGEGGGLFTGGHTVHTHAFIYGT